MSVKIGVVGLGTMGLPMAHNLVNAGYTVVGYDPVAAAMQAAVEMGIEPADSVGALGTKCSHVLTMLPTGAHLSEVMFGDEGLANSLSPGALIIDSSTIDIATSKRVGAALAERGISFVDAPVSGGVAAARGGHLTFMVGGSIDDFAAAHTILTAMGRRIVHAGSIGAGQAAKICNNMLFGATLTAVSEMFILANKLGLSPNTLFDIVSNSTGDSWALRNFCPWPGVVADSASSNGYEPRFAAALMRKDIVLASGAATTAEIWLPLLESTRQVFEICAEEYGHLDASAVIRTVSARANQNGDVDIELTATNQGTPR